MTVFRIYEALTCALRNVVLEVLKDDNNGSERKGSETLLIAETTSAI